MQALTFAPLVADSQVRSPTPLSLPETQVDQTQPTVTATAFYQKMNSDMAQLADANKDTYAKHISNNQSGILSAAKGFNKKALVVGIGNGTDIPLKELAQQFEQLTLVDIDSEAIQRAISTLEPKLQKKNRHFTL
jgi:hypothetical protein